MSRAPSRGAAKAPTRRQPARVVKPAARRRSPTVGAQVSRALEGLPVPRKFFATLRNWSLGLFLGGGIITGVIAMGVPQIVGLSIAHGLGAMGFVVRNVEITGRKQVDADAVYRVVMDARGQDMPLVDLTELRGRLLQIGWVQDARVSRRLPDTLAVDIVERAPAAILQRNQQLYLIDAGGAVLAGADPRLLPLQLPLVIGPNVERHLAELQALMASQPTMKQLVAGATWIGDRRWDVRFQSGETLALPEGEAAAKTAYADFARRDAQERLLGRGFVRFDMRVPGQLVVRTSQEPGAKIEDPVPPPVAAPDHVA